MGYAFEHNGIGYTPEANSIPASAVSEHNRQTEQEEIAWLQTHPEKVTLYVRTPSSMHDYAITLWTGTVVASHGNCIIGNKVRVGGIAGPHAYKRAVDCRIFGCRYVGWFYESAGDYCRLHKSKRQ